MDSRTVAFRSTGAALAPCPARLKTWMRRTVSAASSAARSMVRRAEPFSGSRFR